MKKLFFIFILITLIGLFSPLIKVQGLFIEDVEIPEQKDTLYGEIKIDLEDLGELSEKEKIDCTLPENKTKAECATPEKTTPVGDGSYILLQPLPCNESLAGCPKNGELVKIDPSGTGKLGEYLNLMIRLFIGLCAVAAVVMIVIAGIEYSASELTHTKEDAKNRIQGAILGLILALGSYALLFTINPDLLRTDVDISGATLSSEGEVEIENLREDTPLTASESKGEGLKLCTQGLAVSKYNTKKLCKNIIDKYDELILAAKSAGLTIVASGYRCSKPGPGCVGETQTSLRIRNCHGDLYNPNAKCDRTTAPVGTSKHENGLAFDVLKCTQNGKLQSITGRGGLGCNASCLVWLRDNASRFDFYNNIYPVNKKNGKKSNDCVHFSTDGY